MELKKLIEERFGSVDKMIEETNILISRTHLYRIINGETNPTLQAIQTIADAMGLDFTEVYKAIKETKVVSHEQSN